MRPKNLTPEEVADIDRAIIVLEDRRQRTKHNPKQRRPRANPPRPRRNRP